MKALIFFICFLPFLCTANESVFQVFDLGGKKILPLENWEIRADNGPGWAERSEMDDAWKRVFLWRTPPDGNGPGMAGRFWLRTVLILQGEKDETDIPALFFNRLPSAFEVFWDGKPIARNGRLGQERREEIPGKIRGFIRIPGNYATGGRHLLTIRVSNYHVHKKAHRFGILFGYHSSLTELLSRKKEESLLYVGLFLTAALFSLFLFLAGWRYFPALIFTIFTLLQLSNNLWEYLLRSEILNVSLFYRLNLVFLVSHILSFLPLNLFIIWHLEIPRRKALSWILSVLALLRILLFFLFHWDLWYLDFALAFVVFALIVRQIRQGKIGSGTALTGYGIFLANWMAIVLMPLLPGLAFAGKPFVSLAPSSVFLVGLMGSIMLKLREQFRTLAALRFRSQRLEAELLKKSIQPHFIMNTLLSIKSFLGRDSRKAEKLIEALAEEFRLINRIAAALEIPLPDELNLCRLHLEVMGFRRDACYTLKVEGQPGAFSIPPMILHTLIENGLTHAYRPRENGIFRFVCKREEHKVVFRLENDGSNLAEMLKGEEAKIEEGMGMRYVRARLDEAYSGKWRLDYGLNAGVWFVQIERGDA